MLDLNVLTIGFARRFATYKRANLVLRDPKILAEMVDSSEHPIQLVFAAKLSGRSLRQGIDPEHRQARQGFPIRPSHRVRGRCDMNVAARHLVQGVDVWLNNLRRPQEASGTSGEKVLLNGGLNFSILDGWWAEAYDGGNGRLPSVTARLIPLHSIQDDREARGPLLHTLKNQVVPLLLRSRRVRPAPSPVDRPPKGRHAHSGMAIQRRPHGDGLRHEQLSSRGRRAVVRDAEVEVVSCQLSVFGAECRGQRTVNYGWSSADWRLKTDN